MSDDRLDQQDVDGLVREEYEQTGRNESIKNTIRHEQARAKSAEAEVERLRGLNERLVGFAIILAAMLDRTDNRRLAIHRLLAECEAAAGGEPPKEYDDSVKPIWEEAAELRKTIPQGEQDSMPTDGSVMHGGEGGECNSN